MKHKLLLVLACTLPFAASAGNFSGPYAGAHLGYVDGDDSGKELDRSTGEYFGWSQDASPSGTLFGIFGGYNWALANKMIVGVEADFESRSADETSFQKDDGVPDTRYPVKAELDSAYSLRAKLGYVFNANKTLAFATAGRASAKIERTFTSIPQAKSVNSSKRTDGWAFGFGVEHLLANKLSLKAEYRLTNYDDVDVDVSALYTDTIERQKYEEQALRVGIAYAF